MLSQIPLNHFGTVDDISETVKFLASDAAKYITGQTIHVNGGMYMGQDLCYYWREVNLMANFDKVKDIIVDKLGIDEEKVTQEASFKDDLGADSLDIAELVMELEDEFEMEIPDEEAEKINTVGDALNYIDKLEAN